MKYRTGFVANSSSSSFIIVFKVAPTCFEDVHKAMFPDGPCRINHPYDDMVSYTSAEIAETVWSDIQGKEPVTHDAIVSEFDAGHVGGEPNMPESVYRLKGKAWEEAYDKHCAEVDAYHKKAAAEFMSRTPGVYHIVEYEDHSTHGSFMEHGNVFRFIPHQRISKH